MDRLSKPTAAVISNSRVSAQPVSASTGPKSPCLANSSQPKSHCHQVGEPVEIRLQTGRVIAGRLLDTATGKPLAGIPLYAITENSRHSLKRYEPKQLANRRRWSVSFQHLGRWPLPRRRTERPHLEIDCRGADHRGRQNPNCAPTILKPVMNRQPPEEIETSRNMTTLIEALSGPAWRQILLTLAHSLWQGVALASLLALSFLTNCRQPTAGPLLASIASLSAAGCLVFDYLVGSSICHTLWHPASSARSRPMASQQTLDSATPPQSADSVSSSIAPLVLEPGGSTISNTASPARFGTPDFWGAASAACSVAWLVGVLTMLAPTLALLVTGAQRLGARSPLADLRVLDLVESLRHHLGISRPIAVVDSTSFGPAVLGILRPVLLLPAAIISELPADCLEAIVARELAHIRRHDYLVNLVQMLVEQQHFPIRPFGGSTGKSAASARLAAMRWPSALPAGH